MIAVRAPHGRRSRNVKVVRSHKTSLETGLLLLAWIGFFIPLIWLASPVLSFAEYPLRLGPLVAGVFCFVIGLWLFYKSHADLGTNWSITLEVREQHRLITQGVYRRVRHPMYSALVLYSVGQALVIPNWVAGPSNFVVFVILFSLRVHAEEQMMGEAFGDEYAAYRHERSDWFLVFGRQCRLTPRWSRRAHCPCQRVHRGARLSAHR